MEFKYSLSSKLENCNEENIDDIKINESMYSRVDQVIFVENSL